MGPGGCLGGINAYQCSQNEDMHKSFLSRSNPPKFNESRSKDYTNQFRGSNVCNGVHKITSGELIWKNLNCTRNPEHTKHFWGFIRVITIDTERKAKRNNTS